MQGVLQIPVIVTDLLVCQDILIKLTSLTKVIESRSWLVGCKESFRSFKLQLLPPLFGPSSLSIPLSVGDPTLLEI
jgi:hypothetical protein